MGTYETDEHRKLRMLIESALLNKTTTGGNKIVITTLGSSPHMSMTIEAYVLDKCVKESV